MFNIRRMEVCHFNWRLTLHGVDRRWIVRPRVDYPLRTRQPKDLIDIQKCNQYNLPENYPMTFCKFPFYLIWNAFGGPLRLFLRFHLYSLARAIQEY